jgi:hypothetical protein
MKFNRQILITTCLLFTTASCSTYPSKFICGDAKGLGCTMLRDVNNQIDSGEIKKVYEESKRKSC